MTLSIIK